MRDTFRHQTEEEEPDVTRGAQLFLPFAVSRLFDGERDRLFFLDGEFHCGHSLSFSTRSQRILSSD